MGVTTFTCDHTLCTYVYAARVERYTLVQAHKPGRKYNIWASCRLFQRADSFAKGLAIEPNHLEPPAVLDLISNF